LGECLFRSREPEEDVPVYLALVLRRKDQGGNHAADLRRHVSNHIVRSFRMPGRPARRRDQDASTSAARGVTAPMPVTTIRRIYAPTNLGTPPALPAPWLNPVRILCGHSIAIAACFTSADTERPRRRRHRPILSSGDGFANLFDRRIQKGLSEVGVVDDAR
jgi:hypothetical protein